MSPHNNLYGQSLASDPASGPSGRNQIEEEDVSEATPSYYWSPIESPNHINNADMAIVPNDTRSQLLGAINTDYESSAAEDYDESFTTSKYENAESAFLSYSRTNKLEKLQTLLQAKLKNETNLDLNYKGHQKQNFSWSALHLACYFGHVQVVELLLSKKAFCDEIDINVQNNSGDTPLHKAVLTDRVQIVQLLLSHGADVLVKNCDGLSAKQLTKDKHILELLDAAEKADKNRTIREMFKSVDNGDLKKLQEYLETYGSLMEIPQDIGPSHDPDATVTHQAIASVNAFTHNNELISQMTDERGNTLLHLATMRGFKAICVYLLELGFDPYRKNNIGQSSIDLASYQLRHLFTTVKPASSHLRKLTSQRVTRFEGPLLKKVRILGWKQIYVVLENGVILLFNNRRDSMNKSRRGYKYLESASCEPEANDLGTFTLCFSDKSRATFLVSSDHISSYASFKTTSDYDKAASSGNQIELIRQKWIDSLRDHISYSTNFIKNGFKMNDYDDNNQAYDNDGDLTTLNHLLPIDTIKSFIQEARAHYSILERHADSLCNLVQSINATSRDDGTQSIDQSQPSVTSGSSATTNTAGSRLFNFIRSSKQNRSNSINAEDSLSISSQQSLSTIRERKKTDDKMNEFMQDNWHCILFHLRLLVESTEKTRVSMDQALVLMENQEQLRQNRIQDQEEKCRVLEDSLQALARDHHQLEKSLSMSQIYHSAGNRSISLSVSTDLNEYYDAFEDFDDAASRTLTPTSMPSDEDLDQRIHEVMIETNQSNLSESKNDPHALYVGDDAMSRYDSTDNEQDDDLHSNCSALTVETNSDVSVLTIETSKQLNVGGGLPNAHRDAGGNKFRTRLPSPMVPRDQVSIWSILKNCIGKELSKITMPVVFNEPLTMLQRACEGIQYSHYLKMADECDDPVERMEYVITFIIAGLSGNCHRIIKPFNPLLYETYELTHELLDGSQVKVMSQQVSHHPPITAAYAESENFIYNGCVNPKIKFWGRSVEVEPDGQNTIYLKRHKETYIFKTVSCSVHNVIVGKLWFEHRGPLEIRCAESGVQANLMFRQTGWFGASNDLHRFDGFIVSEKKKRKYLYGKWSDYIKSVNHTEYEEYLKNSNQKVFKIPDKLVDNPTMKGVDSRFSDLGLDNSVNNNSIPNTNSTNLNSVSNSQRSSTKSGDKVVPLGESVSTLSSDIPNSTTLWKLQAQYFEEYYNFTLYTMRLNELDDELSKTLPRTDSRFRLDVRKLEEGDLDGAASEKQRLEEKQREVRSRDKRFKDPSADLLWFDLIDMPSTKEKLWVFKGGYWENKCNPEKFPDLF